MERPTIADIAQRAGVSKARVLGVNGRPGVSELTRARILAIADEMQWRPHSAARARASPARGCGSRPVPTCPDARHRALLRAARLGLQAGLSTDGTALQLLIVEDRDAEIGVLTAAGPPSDGSTASPSWTFSRTTPASRCSSSWERRAVVGGPLDESSKLSYAWADDTEAMLSLIDYLAALGHHDIVHVAGLPQFRHTQRRMEALEGSRERLDLNCRSIPTDYSDSEGAAITRRLLSSRERPTAIVYDSDVMAVAGLGVALEMGVRVPADLSMVSFEDSLLTRLTHPALTALARDTQAWDEHRPTAPRARARLVAPADSPVADAAARRAREHGAAADARVGLTDRDASRPRLAPRPLRFLN